MVGNSRSIVDSHRKKCKKDKFQKVRLVFGTRPEAIKMCPLVNELKTKNGIKTVVCVTAQHRQMLDLILEIFGVVPDYDLNIIHMNPAVRQAVDEELSGCEQIHIIEPIEVFDCHNFEARAFLCLTDSGGIQEECPSYGVPVLVMRDMAERPEGVDAGTLRLVGTDEEEIYRNFKELLEDKDSYEAMSHACNPYGNGHACKRIADILETGEYEPWSVEE